MRDWFRRTSNQLLKSTQENKQKTELRKWKQEYYQRNKARKVPRVKILSISGEDLVEKPGNEESSQSGFPKEMAPIGDMDGTLARKGFLHQG